MLRNLEAKHCNRSLPLLNSIPMLYVSSVTCAVLPQSTHRMHKMWANLTVDITVQVVFFYYYYVRKIFNVRTF